MGTRGSKYYENKTKKVEQQMRDSKKERYIELPYDPESERIDYELFNQLKQNGISVRQSTDNATLEELRPHQEQLLNLSKKYKSKVQELSKHSEIKLCMHTIDDAWGYWRPGDDCNVTRIALSGTVIKRNYFYVALKQEAIDKGESALVDKQNVKIFTTTHEFGHMLEDCIIHKRYLKEAKHLNITYSEYQKVEAERIKNQVVKILQNKYTLPVNDDMIYVSSGAKKGVKENAYFEWFAETFTNLELSSKPMPIAKALGEYIRSVE